MDHSARVKITTFPNIEVLVYPSDEYPGWWYVKTMITSPDAITGKPEGFESPVRYKYEGEPDTQRLAAWVRETVLWQLEHELDEGLTVDGQRVYDPHKDDK